MPELLAEALRRITHQKPDLLVVTGDILDVPYWLMYPPRVFAIDQPTLWRQAVEKDYRMVKQLLDDSGLRYTVLGGNHDLSEIMWQIFDPDENIFDLAGHRIVRFCDEEFDAHVPRRFLKERCRFDQVLADPSSPPQVHLQHYLLTPMMNESWPFTYGEGDELTRRVVESGRVRLCLSGHLHPGLEMARHGNTFFSVARGFTVYPHPWSIYDISPDGQVSRHEQTLSDLLTPPSRVVFLDRDGVINDLASYQTGPEEMRLIPGSAQAIRQLNQAGWKTVVITSQSAVGYGYVSEETVLSVHDKMCRLLAEQGACLDGIYFSTAAGDRAVLPQYRDQSGAKPNPTQLYSAQEELNLTLDGAWMVGDHRGDIVTACAAGVQPILVRSGAGRQTEQCSTDLPSGLVIVEDLAAAVQHILK